MSTSGISGTGSTSSIITPQSIDSSGGLTSTSTLTNSGAGGQLQITGLGSGIDTNALIQAELAEKELPLINMQDEISSMQNVNSTLGSIQTALQNLSMDAFDLGSPTLFFQSQTVTSSDSNLVTATTTANIGAPIGSTTLEVDQLASASQATYAYTAPSDGSTDTLNISVSAGAQSVTVTSGESLQNIANSINGDNQGVVYATVLNGQLVLSSRQTGDGGTTGSDGGNPIAMSVTNSATSSTTPLTAASTVAGQDAKIVVNPGTPGATTAYSQSDTVTNAVAGVSLTLQGVTPTNAPLTLTTGAPAPDTQSIITAVQQFVSDYNGLVSGVEQVINTAPASESDSTKASPYTDNLFGDPELENLLSSMRETMYTNGAGLASGMASLSDIGISTGASNGTVQQSAVQGLLSVDTDQLTQAIQSNPDGVKAVLASWATSFQNVANAEGSAFGAIETRIQGNNTLISGLQNQLSTAQEMYNTEEANMQEQWAQVEATLSSLNSQKTSLASFTSGLSSSSSSSSSS